MDLPKELNVKGPMKGRAGESTNWRVMSNESLEKMFTMLSKGREWCSGKLNAGDPPDHQLTSLYVRLIT